MPNKANPVAEFIMKSGGKMAIELYAEEAPITVANFVDLVKKGFYDGLNFHRVVEGFVIQGGAKNGTCAGEDLGFTVKGEFKMNGVDTGLTHPRGAISMARSGHPDSASTQFFICHQECSSLNNQYAAFGVMISGFDVLDAIAATPTKSASEENRPLEPQIIDKVVMHLNGYEPAEPVRIGQMI